MVEFSQIYMLVQQSFVVPDSSRIRAVADIDARGLRIAGGRGILSRSIFDAI